MTTKQYANLWLIFVYLSVFNPAFFAPSVIPTALLMWWYDHPKDFDFINNPDSIPYVPQYIAEFGYVLKF